MELFELRKFLCLVYEIVYGRNYLCCDVDCELFLEEFVEIFDFKEYCFEVIKEVKRVVVEVVLERGVEMKDEWDVVFLDFDLKKFKVSFYMSYCEYVFNYFFD